MKKYKFKKIDAFATIESDGNPAGYIRLDSKSDITESEMQKIAKELKGYVNEVGFIVQTSDNEFDLKYYSSEREVDFCGHATIAILYDLIKNDNKLRQFEFLQIQTNRGKLIVENRIALENAVFITSPVPVEKEIFLGAGDIADNLKISREEIDPDLPISIINAGLTTLLVPIKSLKSILEITPHYEELKDFCLKSGLDIIEVFTSEVANKSSNFRVRVFAPTFGYIEDPATGSGNSAFGYYLINNGLFNGETVIIEQNGSIDRFNIVKLQKQFDENKNVRVLFGGSALTRIEGEYILQ
jgi:PhzF family phenazine biosynthesis protein